MKKYTYIAVDTADEFYEDGGYFAKFDTYEDMYAYLNTHKYDVLLERLKYLESIKDTLHGNTIVVCYS